MANLPREEYRKIKQMNNQQMSEYFRNVYQRGYDDGRKDQASQSVKPEKAKSSTVD